MDKLYHVIASLSIMLGLSFITSIRTACVVVIVIGILKELVDKFRGGIFDWQDIIVDLIGVFLGALLAAILLCPSNAQAFELSYPEVDKISVDFTFAPPHNEPVIGNLVARYRVRNVVSAHWERLSLLAEFNLWACNRWRTPSQVGHGIPDAWKGSDWSIDEWRWDANYEVAYKVHKHFDIFTEYKWTEEYKGHDSYYWLTGFRINFL